MTFEERLQQYENLTFLDDYMMKRMFSKPGKEKLFEKIVSIVLDRNDISITSVESEKMLIGNTKSVVLDALGQDKEGKVYDLEIQNYKESDIGLRVRAYGGIIDMNYLNRGDDYSKLPERYIIFICDRDPYADDGSELAARCFVTMDTKEGKLIGDMVKTYFVNCSYQGEERKELITLIHDMNCASPNDLKIPEIKNIMEILKTKEEAMAYTNVVRDSIAEGREAGRAEGRAQGRAEGRAEGLKEGRAEEKKSIVLRLISKGFDDAEIADITELTIEEIQKIRKENC